MRRRIQGETQLPIELKILVTVNQRQVVKVGHCWFYINMRHLCGDVALASNLGDYLAAITLNDVHKFHNLWLWHPELVKRVANFMGCHVELKIG